MGLACYVKAFIRDYSKHVALLTTMIGQEKKTKKTVLEWSPEAQSAVNNLKKNLMNPLALHSVDLTIKNSQLHVFVDASDRSYGCVLYQKILHDDADPEYRLVDYYSKVIASESRWQGILLENVRSRQKLRYFDIFFVLFGIFAQATNGNR